ncbi:MAG: hypothetical protein A2Y41_00305 [Spirochaetes bacterium GWB1_36_13]|nr:MAG: hypothetical protein A2Y41_00305 [Spirochaetes bacterium GWB1_36_13]
MFSVRDTGSGIEREYQKKMFEKFSQENMSYNKKYGGAGLGLAIVKELVALMNGTIFIESEPGK